MVVEKGFENIKVNKIKMWMRLDEQKSTLVRESKVKISLLIYVKENLAEANTPRRRMLEDGGKGPLDTHEPRTVAIKSGDP